MIELARFDDWRERLAAFLDERRGQAFDWRWANCGLTACDAVVAMTGTDIAGPMRGGYATAYGATRQLVRLGYRSILLYLDDRLERTARAREGDLVWADAVPIGVLMVCAGNGRVWAQNENGIEYIAAPGVTVSWRV